VSSELKRLEEEQARHDPDPLLPMERADLMDDRDYSQFAMRVWRGIAVTLAIPWVVWAAIKLGGIWVS
jgi:hypothetical protein